MRLHQPSPEDLPTQIDDISLSLLPRFRLVCEGEEKENLNFHLYVFASGWDNIATIIYD